MTNCVKALRFRWLRKQRPRAMCRLDTDTFISLLTSLAGGTSCFCSTQDFSNLSVALGIDQVSLVNPSNAKLSCEVTSFMILGHRLPPQ